MRRGGDFLKERITSLAKKSAAFAANFRKEMLRDVAPSAAMIELRRSWETRAFRKEISSSTSKGVIRLPRGHYDPQWTNALSFKSRHAVIREDDRDVSH